MELFFAFFFAPLHFIASLVFLYIGVKILRRNKTSELHVVAFFNLLAFSIWAFGDTFTSSILFSEFLALFSGNIAAIGWLAFSPLFLWITLILAGIKEKYPKFSKSIIFVFCATAFILLLSQWLGYLVAGVVKTYYGWGDVWGSNSWVTLFYVFLIACSGLSLAILGWYAYKTKDRSNKIRAVILLVSSTTPLLLGSLSNILLPVLGVYEVPNIADIFALVWGFGFYYSMTHYNMFPVSATLTAQKIISVLPTSLFIVDPSHLILSVNKKAKEVFGYTESELVGSHFKKVLSKSLGDSGAKFHQSLSDIELKDFSLHLLHKSGKKIPVTVSNTLVFNDLGELGYIIVIVKDLREIQGYAEKKLEVLGPILLGVSQGDFKKRVAICGGECEFKKLFTMINKVIEKLEILKYTQNKAENEKLLAVSVSEDHRILAAEKQVELIKTKAEFSSIFAHQLRSPITGIKAMAEACLMDKKHPLDKNTSKTLNKILKAANKESQLIDDLLLISRIETSSLKFNREMLDMGEVTQEIIDEVKELPIAKGFTIRLKKVSKKIKPMIMDRKLYRQSIYNYLTNAVRYSNKIKKIEVAIDLIEAKDEDNKLRLSVKDFGIGIPKKDQSQIFGKFFRSSNAENKVHDGTGLGLYVVKMIADLSGANVWFETSTKGTTFFIERTLAPTKG